MNFPRCLLNWNAELCVLELRGMHVSHALRMRGEEVMAQLLSASAGRGMT